MPYFDYDGDIHVDVDDFLSACDGDEINGAPGVSVIHYLEECGIVYTGADAAFYNITTSKVPMKKAFDGAGVSNAPWDHFTN